MTAHIDAPTAPSHRDQLRDRRARATDRVAPREPRQFTARERAEHLVDQGTFVPIKPMRAVGPGLGAGVVAGFGLVGERPVMVVSQDASVGAGAIGPVLAEVVHAAQELAIERGYPIVYLNDSGGARIHDGIAALHACGGIFRRNVLATRRVPQISVILGPSAGAAAYSPALTDWTIMVRQLGQMFLTGPEIVRAATGEDASADEIGGADVHTNASGVSHLAVDSEEEAMDATRRLLSFLPSHAGGDLPWTAASEPDAAAAVRLPEVVPERASAPFNMNAVLDGVLDDGPRFELMGGIAKSVLTQFGRLNGQPVGIVANQPNARGGILDSDSAVKAARFVDFCGRFGIPVLTFVDVPGFMPGTAEEKRGVITHGARLLRAYAEHNSPLLTVIVRKAYGGAYIAMGAASIGADFTWAWSGAEIAVMGPAGAVALLHRRELAAAENPAALRESLAADYRENVARPWIAAEAGIVDDVILPEETRARMIAALAVLGVTAR